MKIYLQKFGTTLVSRQTGREAFAALQPQLDGLTENETLELDFEGVITFSPSWGDEFLSPLLDRFKNKLVLKNTENPSVQATLKLLEKVHNTKFKLSEEK